ncbi:MAG: hypothetical protein QNJ16_19955 [Rhodobacter sp.]|nr:hypothetical protein [Rhodobacter sp.]
MHEKENTPQPGEVVVQNAQPVPVTKETDEAYAVTVQHKDSKLEFKTPGKGSFFAGAAAALLIVVVVMIVLE